MPEVIGTVLNKRYRLDAELGRGGMGMVYRAHDLLLKRDVAVKVLSASTLGTEGRARLLHEARATAKLNHPNIVSLYDAGEANRVPYIVMEYLEGETLAERRPASLEETIAVARQICSALEHAHEQGIIHRDLKPENIIIASDGHIKLTDFGLARSVASRMTAEGALTGTVFYLPPEQALGKEIDGRADLYSLGVILYEFATDRLPFRADEPLAVISQHLYTPPVPPRTYNHDMPVALELLIMRLLSKEPQERPTSASEVREALESLGTEVDLLTPPAPPSPLDQLVRGRLVGREREFAEARSAWQQAAAGSGSVLLVSGEPGVGKTPFVREITALAQVSGGQTLLGECYAEGSAPFTPIAQITLNALSLPDLELPQLVMSDLVALSPDLRAHYPAVEPKPLLDPQAERQRLFESVVVLCSALASHAPLLLIVEDVQWADCGTLGLLRHLARRARRQRLLIVMTYREVEVDEDHPLHDVLYDLTRERLALQIRLPRYNREQTRELLAAMFQQQVPDDFVDAIYHKTEGNHFFVEEVCRALVEEGKVYRDNSHWRQPAHMDEIEIPTSVRLTIQSRVSKLPEEAQEALRLAAIIGREFDFKTLQQASEIGEDALIDALEQAERAQLIGEGKQPGQESFVFAHGLIPAALRESVSGLRRRRLHRRIAAAIEGLHPDDFEALAYHHKEAGNEASALTYTIRAAERARSLYANDEAIRLYSSALALLSADPAHRFDLLAARAQVYGIVANRTNQRADVDEMLRIAAELNDDARRCDALLALADLYLATEFLQVHEPAEQAVALARSLHDPVREGHALCRLGYNSLQRGDLAASRDELETATARFREAGLPGEAATSLHMLSLALGKMGEHEAALEAAQQALSLSRAADNRLQEATSLRRLAIVYINTDRPAEALPLAKAALDLHRELGDQAEECNALNVVGILLGSLGHEEEAREHLLQSLEIGERIGAIQGVSNATGNLLWRHFRPQGEFETALAFLDQHSAKAQESGNETLAAAFREQKAFWLANMGQSKPAIEILEALYPAMKQAMSQNVASKYAIFLAFLYADLREYDRARQYLASVDEQAEMPGTAGNLLLGLAYIALLEGDQEKQRQGREQAQQAVEQFRGGEWKNDLTEALSILSLLHLKLGESEEAVARSSEALALLEQDKFVPEGVYLAHWRALHAADRKEEAIAYLRRAYEQVMAAADRFSSDDLRRGWLENVVANREIVADWASSGLAR